MKFRLGAACATLAIATLFRSPAAAQSTDAFVLPWGMFRLSVQGTQESFDSRFDAAGDRVPLADGLQGGLTPDRFVALQPLSTSLADFFAATAGGAGDTGNPVDPAAISLGTLDVAAAGSRTHAPAQLSFGLLPRVEIGVSLPISRSGRTVQRFGVAGGNLGINPDRVTNGEVLATIGWEPLGTSELLPVADSPAGIELQSRATALTGSALTLPTDTVGAEALQSLLGSHYGLPPLAARLEPWRLGDTELFGRVLLISTFGQAPMPVDSTALHMRLAVSGGLRLATGTAPDSFPLLAAMPAERLSAYHAGGAADFFFGPRLWVHGAARLTWNNSSEVTRRVLPPDAPLSVVEAPRTVTISPGNLLELAFAPRFRLIESIAIGAEYTAAMVGDTEYSGGGSGGTDVSVLNLAGGGLHKLGVGIRYTSLPAYQAGTAALPAEVALTYQRTLAGPEGMTAGGAMTITASVLPQLWGRSNR